MPFVPPRWPISCRHGKDRNKVCGLGRNLIRKGSWVLKVSESCFKMALSSKVRQLLMGMGAYAQTTKGFDRVAKAVSRKKMKGNTPSGAKPNIIQTDWIIKVVYTSPGAFTYGAGGRRVKAVSSREGLIFSWSSFSYYYIQRVNIQWHLSPIATKSGGG